MFLSTVLLVLPGNPLPAPGQNPCQIFVYTSEGMWVQVLLAVMARGYEWRPVDINEPFSCFPLGGHPINGLPMDFIKLPQPRIQEGAA